MKRSLLWVTVFLSPVFGAVDIQWNGAQPYTSVLLNGSTAVKYNIVFVGDGFTSSQQSAFNARVNDAVAALESKFPDRMCGFNIYRVNVVSEQSGVDHPGDTPPVWKNTELNVRYGNPAAGEVKRCIRTDTPERVYEAASYAPAANAIFVLANDLEWGGCAGDLVFSSVSPGFMGIVTHELGHKVGGLADEYQCKKCDGSDSNLTFTGPEPNRPNVTKVTNPLLIKWKDLILPGTPLPTTVDNPPGVVGLWEGAFYHAYDIYRPQRYCHMRESGSEFCAVCNRTMRQEISSHCTPCEIDPDSIECIVGPLTTAWQLWYLGHVSAKFPIPWGCLTCPPDGLEDKWRYELRGAPADFKVSILDERGNIVATSTNTAQGLAVVWTGNRSSQYSVQVTSAGTPSGTLLNLNSVLFRNGEQQVLAGME